MDRGSSPLMTVQKSCLSSPMLTASSPNVKGRILGGSKYIYMIKKISSLFPVPFCVLYIQLPLTLRSAECDVEPAVFLALQVYSPECLYDTEEIISSDVLDPS